jgi:hypothetical protein
MKRTTIFLPEEVHARLRHEAHEARLSMAELIRRKLEVPEPESELAEPDPLLAVAGLWSDGTLCENLDEELYDL